MQLTQDLATQPFSKLRILDLGCGEGVYAIEAGLRGATVLALDARAERMEVGAACAARHGLGNVDFRQEDVRAVTPASHGVFDVVYCLGLLYHLDSPDVLTMLATIAALCRTLLVVDTFVTLTPDMEAEHRGDRYEGTRFREHADDDSAETRRTRVLKSIDNTFSFKFTKASLVRALRDVGFSSVLEAHAPLEPMKPEDRVTLVCRKGDPVTLSTYPWLNGKSEEQIEQTVEGFEGGA